MKKIIQITNYIPVCILLITLYSCDFEMEGPRVPNYTKVPKHYIAQYTQDTITIDGQPNEKVWEKAEWTENFIDIEGKIIPIYQTRIKMIWDNENLYFFAELEEPHIWATLRQKDSVLFYNNDFEIFIDKNGNTHNYYELEINALNTIWDLFLSKPYRNNGTILNNWDIKNMKTTVQINGTLNNPLDIDTSWTIEIAMPWASLIENAHKSQKLPVGKIWRMNFSRVNWQHDLINGKYVRKIDPETNDFFPEYNWVWSPQEVINMHEPERWGYVMFSGKKVGTKETFTYEKDALLKQKLYLTYRKVLFQKERFNRSLMPDYMFIENYRIKIFYEAQQEGVAVYVTSPFTDITWYINKEGKLLTIKKLNNYETE